MIDSTKIEEIKVIDLFNKHDKEFIIPIYQRDYAWEKKEIVRLLDDIFYHFEDVNSKNDVKYYIGSMVVYQASNNKYEVIDGQQRLTTFYILFQYLNQISIVNMPSRLTALKFQSRPSSTYTLGILKMEDIQKDLNDSNLNFHIMEGYKVIQNYFIGKEDKIENLIKYLNRVVLMQVMVPDDTDLNHYFEIMNNRGEQLEETELVRAKFFGLVKKEYPNLSELFITIWDKLANMEEYFEVLDNNWIANYFNFQVKEKNLSDNNLEIEQEFTLESILKLDSFESITETDSKVKFSSILSFEYFLLMVYSIYFNRRVLNKKDFLNTFYSNEEFTADVVINFLQKLIVYRVIFDRFIIKREVDDTSKGWDILTLSPDYKYYYQSFGSSKNINENAAQEELEKSLIHDRIKQLQSFFQVSYTSPNYKYWLLDCLQFLEKNVIIKDNSIELVVERVRFYEFIFNLSENYIYSKLLDFDFKRSQSSLTKLSNDQLKSLKHEKFTDLAVQNPKSFDYLNNGTAIGDDIFNFIEYKIYDDLFFKDENSSVLKKYKLNKQSFKPYYFHYNNSVEHLYAQNQKLDQGKINYLNNIGNLCLLSTSLNSTLSNATVENKLSYIKSNNILSSLKLLVMDATLQNTTDKVWNDNVVKQNYSDIIELLRN